MAERRMNLLSLVTGLLALGIAGLYFLDRTDALSVDAPVVAASSVLALGLAGLIGSARRLLSRSQQE